MQLLQRGLNLLNIEMLNMSKLSHHTAIIQVLVYTLYY